MTKITGEDRLAGDPGPEEMLARIVRVDHAGEYGAKRIYAGQLAVLERSEHGPIIRHMAEQEEKHLKYFETAIGDRGVRPTALLPLWHAAGFALGAATGTPAVRSSSVARACFGLRTPTKPLPAVTSTGSASAAGATRVSGPGQKLSASRRMRAIPSGCSCTSVSAASTVGT